MTPFPFQFRSIPITRLNSNSHFAPQLHSDSHSQWQPRQRECCCRKTNRFYFLNNEVILPRDAMLPRLCYGPVSVRLSICLSVTSRNSAKKNLWTYYPADKANGRLWNLDLWQWHQCLDRGTIPMRSPHSGATNTREYQQNCIFVVQTVKGNELNTKGLRNFHHCDRQLKT